MVYHFLYPLTKFFQIFNITKYITFRGASAFITSFIIVLLFYRLFIKKVTQLQCQEHVDMYGHLGLESLHQAKQGTPTMGGVLIILAITVSLLLWGKFNNSFLWITFLSMALLGGLGFLDDIKKIKTKKGIGRKEKFLAQCCIGTIIGVFMVIDPNTTTKLDLPFFKEVSIDLRWWYVLWSLLVIAATSNAVNFTDGLDGLAIGGVITNCFVFAVLSYITGHKGFSEYLFIPFIPNAGELSVFCAAIVGAGLGFLWFNAPPAQLFMGDVGALALGGVIGVIALYVKKEFLLVFSGGLFVIEALSVVIQIVSVRWKGKKFFRAAPLHHHFQLLGWKESKIVVRFWIVSIMCAVFSLLTLKLR